MNHESQSNVITKNIMEAYLLINRYILLLQLRSQQQIVQQFHVETTHTTPVLRPMYHEKHHQQLTTDK